MRTSARTLFTALALSASLAGCGDDGGTSTTCGTGTTLQDGVCVADPGTSCGSGTTLQNGVCVADPGLTCGPGTVLQGDACVADRTAPGPVTGFAATVQGTNIHLAWTPGASSTKTLVARVANGTYDAPAVDVSYTVGMTLPGGSKVVAVDGTSADDAFTTPGRYSYIAFSQNASGNYGFGREAAVLALPAQTGAITIDVANLTGAVMTQPANLPVTVSDVMYDVNTATLSFVLQATNNTAGELLNIKSVFTQIAGSTGSPYVNAPGQTYTDGKPFVTLGFGGRLPGESVSQTVYLTDVPATDTLTLSIHLVESGMAFLGSDIVDVAGGPSAYPELPGIRTPNNSGGAPVFTAGTFSPSGRYVYAGTRYDTDLHRIDTTSGDVASIGVAGEFGSMGCSALGADGFLYVLYTLGQHHYGSGGQGGNSGPTRIAVAKIDLPTMTTVAIARLDPEGSARSRACAIAGTKFVAAYDTNAYVLDTTTMEFIDTDAGTATIDPILFEGELLHDLVPSADGTTVYASSRYGNEIKAANMSTYTVSTYLTSQSGRITSLARAANGTLYFGDGGWDAGNTGALWRYDGTTEEKVPNYNGGAYAVQLVDANHAFVIGNNGPSYVDLTTGDATGQGTLGNGFRSSHTLITFWSL